MSTTRINLKAQDLMNVKRSTAKVRSSTQVTLLKYYSHLGEVIAKEIDGRVAHITSS